MDFNLTPDQEAIRTAIAKVCAAFDLEYWLQKDRAGSFPHDFHAALARDGWLGIAMPVDYGGAGLGIVEAALMMQTITASGAGMSGASAVHMNIFSLNPVVVFGTDAQKKRWLPALIAGRDRACFCVTEPDTGLDTTHLRTRAVRDGDAYVVSGRKIWTSTAQVANKILLLTRTTPIEQSGKPTQGLTLFYTELDRKAVEVREIEKMGRSAVDSNLLFIDNLRVPAADRVGEEGRGFEYLLHGFNPERILVAAEAVGLGRAALERAAGYAKTRIVFGRPIGQNQAIQHPLARCWMELRRRTSGFSGRRPLRRRQTLRRRGECREVSRREAGYRACEAAVMAHGAWATPKFRRTFLREALIPRITPVVLN